jgi:hypothetical protein
LVIHQTTSRDFDNNDDSKDYESIVSTPKLERKRVVKKISATERKSIKSNFTMTLGKTSAPPKFKHKTEGPEILYEDQYNRIRRNLSCELEKGDDNDF